MRAARWALLAVLTAYPVAVVWRAMSAGIALSQDSVSYLATATEFAGGRGLLTFTGEPLTLFPVGYPVLLGLIGRLGVPITGAATAVNLVCLALIVLGTFVLGRLTLPGRWAPLIAAGSVSLSATFLGVFTWLWTEPFFTVVIVGLLIALTWAIRREQAAWWLIVLVAGAVWVATAVRYVGIVTLPIVVWGVWLAASRRSAAREAMVRAVAAGALGLVGPALIAIRNVSAGAGPFGDRVPGSRTMEGAVRDTIDVVGAFFAPPSSTLLTVEGGVLVGVVVMVGMWLAFIRRQRGLLLIAALVVGYSVVMIWSQSATRLDQPSARLMGPVLPALAVLAVYGGRSVLDVIGSQVSRWASESSRESLRGAETRLRIAVPWLLAVVILLPLVMASVSSGLRLARQDDGIPSLSVGLSESPLIAALRQLPGDSGVVSNDPWRVYLALERTPVLLFPPDPDEWPREYVDKTTADLAAAVRDGGVSYAAVFNDGQAVAGIEALTSQGVRIERIAALPDGALLRLESAA